MLALIVAAILPTSMLSTIHAFASFVTRRISFPPAPATQDSGRPAAGSLERRSSSAVERGRVVASGGIRNGLQAVKALALGARWVGVARPFFLAAEHSAEAVVALGSRILTEMRAALFLLGVKTPHALDASHFPDR